MVGCNCAAPSVDPKCCVVNAPVSDFCDTPTPRDFYCGFCEGNGAILACQMWLDCCVANKLASGLSSIRFKTQSGRDSVFTTLRFNSAIQFSKYNRFPNTSCVSLNTPAIFDTLCSIAAAAAFRDRLGEKTHGQKYDRKKDKIVSDFNTSTWSYNDSSTAFHKSVVLLKGQLRQRCMSRSTFEQSYALKWVPAGTPVINVNDTPILAQLNDALEHSCFGLWMSGAFAVSPDRPSDNVKYDESMIMYPVNSWDSSIPCDGFIMLPRSSGSFDIIPYSYRCRKFTFGEVDATIRGTKSDLLSFVDSATQFAKSKSGEDLKCPAWLEVAKRLLSGHDESDTEHSDHKDKFHGLKPPKDPKDPSDPDADPKADDTPDADGFTEDDKKLADDLNDELNKDKKVSTFKAPRADKDKITLSESSVSGAPADTRTAIISGKLAASKGSASA